MERMPNHPETKHSPESREIEQAASERLKHLESQHEHSENNQEHSIEKARERLKHVEAPPPQEHQETERPVGSSGLTRRVSYEFTMKSLRHRLSPVSRSFSKVIHQPIIEKTSEVIGKTVLRPSVSIGATTTAFIVGLFLYLTARQYGFELRGSAIWIALLVGGFGGLIVEAIYKCVHRLGPNPPTR